MNTTSPTYIPLLISSPETGDEIMRLCADGTVVLSKLGADKEAALLFWGSLETEGKTPYARIAELEAQLAAARPKEVYIVTKGEYSDYGILGAFLDRAVADEFAAQRRAEVEVWSLGALDLPQGHRRYCVIMDAEGNTDQYGVDEVPSDDTVEDESFYECDESGPKNQWGMYTRYLYTGLRRMYVTTDMGAQGAVKIANERRIQLLALNRWPEAGKIVE